MRAWHWLLAPCSWLLGPRFLRLPTVRAFFASVPDWPLSPVRWPLLFGSLLLAPGSLLLAAVDGVVLNVTTGKSQPSVIVSLVQPGSDGMKTLGSARSDGEGKFRIDKEIPAGPALLQGLFQGATYNLLLPPGGPTTNVRLKVYDSTVKADAAKLAQHMLLIEPSLSGIRVSDTYLFDNQTNTTFNDPSKGSIQFFVPEAGKSSVRVTVNAPGGMPIQREAEKTAQAGVYKVSYPIKPGESRFDVDYVLPPSATLAGKIMPPDVQARLVTPAAVTLSGDGIQALGQEPKTQAHVYLVTGPTYDVKVDGTGNLREPEAASPEEGSGSPQVLAQHARVYTRLPVVLGLIFAILFLGGVLLYRKGRV